MIDRREALSMLGGAAAATLVPAGVRAATTKVSPLDDVFNDYDALGIAGLVKSGKVAPAELLSAAIARLESVEDTINAVPVRDDEAARQQLARLSAGPFAGVPFLLKDLGVELAGTHTTSGSRYFKDFVAGIDSTIVARHKAAGLVIFGKTASPELGLTGTAESVLHGVTRNPWNLERTVGGSSGGAAAVVAARVIPIAHASDGAGSIRTPASCCGVFGLKPTRGRVPLGPTRLEGWNGLSTQHAVSLTVRDNAALLDATAGPETGSPYMAPPQSRPYLEEVSTPPGKLRVALITTPTSGSAVDPECIRAATEAARLLESLGHTIEEARFPIDHGAANAAILATLAVSTRKALIERERQLGRPATPDDVELVTWRLAEMARKVDAVDYAMARDVFAAAGRAMTEFHRRHDVVLTPTLAKPPVMIGVLSLSPSDYDAYVRDVTTFGPFTALYNMTGQPAMSVPLHWTPDGLPVGVMFAATYGNEALLYRLAGQLEKARPWRQQRPPHAVAT
jgi:amidase/6-aminohexanoate-cyclic-dimer hydrolase